MQNGFSHAAFRRIGLFLYIVFTFRERLILVIIFVRHVLFGTAVEFTIIL